MTIEPPEERGRPLDPALEEALRSGPFHTALHLAIAQSELTLERLEYRLKRRGHSIGRSTLSYWQQGRRRPERPASMRALTVLEEILGLPNTSLSTLLGPRKPRGRWIGYQGQDIDWADMWATTADVRRLTAIDSRRAAERSHELVLTEGVVVGADRRLQRLDFQILVRARQPNADRLLAVYNLDHDTDASKVRLTNTEGCRPGRRRAITEEHLLAFEILYDRALAEGTTHYYRFTMDLSEAYLQGVTPEPSLDFGRVFRRPMSNYIMRTQFHPDALPVRCFHTQATRIGATEHFIGDLLISQDGTTHLAVQNLVPGVHRMKWEWE
jgi:hypothetical protein